MSNFRQSYPICCVPHVTNAKHIYIQVIRSQSFAKKEIEDSCCFPLIHNHRFFKLPKPSNNAYCTVLIYTKSKSNKWNERNGIDIRIFPVPIDWMSAPKMFEHELLHEISLRKDSLTQKKNSRKSCCNLSLTKVI